MLYKFKSAAGADVIMLEASGRQVLSAMGKDGAKGILMFIDMPQALAGLEQACAAEDQLRREQQAAGQVLDPDAISLRMRAKPMAALIQRAMIEKKPITWGV